MRILCRLQCVVSFVMLTFHAPMVSPPPTRKMRRYHHPTCFAVPPRRFKGVSVEEFVDSHLEDRTNDGDYLTDESKKQEIIDAIAYRPPRASTGGASGVDYDEMTPVGKRVFDIKAAMETLPEEDEDAKRPAKKAKKSGDDLEPYARAMKVYDGMKGDDLKSVLRWNLGYMLTGTKDVLMLRLIDGHVNGRLAR